ncbi:MAG: T9SS type A sorting domain-containing protein [Reichenbachiella sp.]|uniref:T9SS type A sorting domain-containing protein n=2 Tax=Reichenbachiella sp. TaxID=2184521 RepID=UPI003265D940
MKKIQLILVLSLLYAVGFGQIVETHLSGDKSAYEGKSYDVVHDLKLLPGFQARAAIEGDFRARYHDYYVNPEPGETVDINASNITITLKDIADVTTVPDGITIIGSVSGAISGTWSQVGRTLTFTADSYYASGEQISVTVNGQLLNLVGQTIHSGFSTQFDIHRVTYVPDDNFELALAAYDNFPLENYVYTSDIESEATLDVRSKGIQDLRGIEGFSNLQILRCSNNSLTNLDLTSNLNLIKLECEQNQLTDINLSTNAVLNELNCSDNQLSNIDLTINTDLTRLVCSQNQLTNLNLSLNTALNYIRCQNNLITTLDLSNISDLTSLYGDYNLNLGCIQVSAAQLASIPTGWRKDDGVIYNLDCNGLAKTYIPDDNFEQYFIDLNLDRSLDDSIYTVNIQDFTTLDIRNANIADLTGIEDFVSLKNLDCASNQLASLDVSFNTALEDLDCAYNNGLTSLNLSNNLALTTMNAIGSNLSCIEVTPAHLAAIPLGWNKDPGTIYSSDCNGIARTYVPDDNFELRLIELGYDWGLDDYVITQNVSNITSFAVSNRNVQSLTGIEDFMALTYLYCGGNQITHLDLSSNVNLDTLYSQGNQLTSLDLSANLALETLYCNANDLTSLTLSNNANLTRVRCDNNTNLLCIEVNQDQLNDAPTNTYWQKDAGASYNLDCSTPSARLGEDREESEEVEIFKTNIALYPNPAQDYFILDMGELGYSQLEIFDLIGNRIMKPIKLTAGENMIMTEKLPTGFVLLRVSGQDHTQTIKLLVE